MFMYLIEVEQPKLVLITGAVGLTLNIISAAFLHGTVLRIPHFNGSLR